MRFRILALAWFCSFVSFGAQAAPTRKSSPSKSSSTSSDILPFKATEKTLPNGLKVIVVPTDFPDIVSLHIPVLTGSRNEVEPGKTGFAHFFEHVMFRGTPQYSSDQWQAIMTGAGARTNANTSNDRTDYHATFAKEDLETILKVEADRFQNLAYSEEDFKTEARAVLGEYNKNSANPFRKLFEVQADKAFTTHTYKHTTMGFIKDIEDMPNQYAYSRLFFKRWYAPQNTALIIAGDVKASEVLPLVEKYWGGWKPSNFKVEIPQEPPPSGPLYAHVPWPSPTIPLLAVAFRGPAFSVTEKDYAAITVIGELYFGSTSDLFEKLVVTEQKIDSVQLDQPASNDPALNTILARVKAPADTPYVRDEILRTVARARAELVEDKRLADAKSNARYSLSRSLDNTDAIAATLVEFVQYNRSYGTFNEFYRVFASLTPEDLRGAARKYFTDEGMVVTTLAQESLPSSIATLPSIASFRSETGNGGKPAEVRFVSQKTALPQLNIKIQFRAGSALDPKGKEGLATLTASMIDSAGSAEMKIDEITKALYPVAGGFDGLVDKEVTTFTASIHRDNADRFFDIVMPMLLAPGYRTEDFTRLKDAQLNRLRVDLRSTNEEELAKERLQGNIFEGTPYAHPAVGTLAGINSITLEDIKSFVRSNYTLSNLTVGIYGDYVPALQTRIQREFSTLPVGTSPPIVAVTGHKARGIEIDIVRKDTRATAISFGHPIAVTRAHPDFAALSVARSWLGEHRSSQSHLYGRIRETRGMNYGDYAYIEAFPGGMFSMTPPSNVPRRAQIFEVWIRPVVPVNAHMAFRIALFELQKLIDNGLTQQQFEGTRDYLSKNVSLLTATQNQQAGYALDSKWYGTGNYVQSMRQQLRKLTLADVNSAIKRHLSAKDLSVVIVTQEAEVLRDQLAGDGFSAIRYDAAKPAELMAEDQVIGAMKLNIRRENVKITPIEEVFAK